MTTDTKPTNPKDAIGSGKLPRGLAPDTAVMEMATAFLEGALKYGRYNWRIAGVRASIYHDAAAGHLAKWWNGQDRDPVTRVRELASVMACCAILIDAEYAGKLTDDRPPPLNGWDPRSSKDVMGLVTHLKELFKAHTPHQYTIADTVRVSMPGQTSGSIPEIRCADCRELVTGPHTCVVKHKDGQPPEIAHRPYCTLDTDHTGQCRMLPVE
jgi:hypothetical protein